MEEEGILRQSGERGKKSAMLKRAKEEKWSIRNVSAKFIMANC